MNWLLNIVAGFGGFLIVAGVICLLLGWVWVGWRRDLIKIGKSCLIAGVILFGVPQAGKFVFGLLNRPPSVEQLKEQAERDKAERDATLAAAAAARAEAQAKLDAANASRQVEQDPARQRAEQLQSTVTQPRPVAQPATRWIVPSGTAGFFITDTGVIDGTTLYLPGAYQKRPGGKVLLVDTTLTQTQFFEETGELAAIEATSSDNQVSTVSISITWMIVPENVPYFKSKTGKSTLYTPIFIDIVRGAVRTVIAKKRWADGPDNILNRDQFARDIQAELDQHTESHFRRLGFGDRSGNIIRYGQVSLRTITRDAS